MKYYTADRETGTFIEEFNSYEEALDAISNYEQEDKNNGDYEENFYSVVDESHCTITE
nr:MAG TPA: YaiA protein [Caudoviricetes sp.]